MYCPCTACTGHPLPGCRLVVVRGAAAVQPEPGPGAGAVQPATGDAGCARDGQGGGKGTRKAAGAVRGPGEGAPPSLVSVALALPITCFSKFKERMYVLPLEISPVVTWC